MAKKKTLTAVPVRVVTIKQQNVGNNPVTKTQFQKITGTTIQQNPDTAGFVRVVMQSGKLFQPTDLHGVTMHLQKLAKQPPNMQQMRQVQEQIQKAGKKKKKQKPKKELTPEEIELRREKNAARHAALVEQEQRQLVSHTYYQGEVVSRGNANAWVKPLNPMSMPQNVRSKLTAMNNEIRNKASAGDGKKQFAGGTDANVVYVRLADVVEDRLVMKPGINVQFKLYTDLKGVGGCEVISE